jgi:diguanylate cyclase (GGDEF)-like protein
VPDTLTQKRPNHPSDSPRLVDADAWLMVQAERIIESGRYLSAFGPALEERFEADTRVQRIRHIRHTIFLGLAVFHLYNFTAFVTTPDLALVNVALRVLGMTPLALLIAWSVGRVSAPLREAFCGLGMIGATAIPIGIFWLGHGPFHLLAATCVGLSAIFSNITLPLRFPWACTVSGTTVLLLLAALVSRREIDAGASAVIMLDLATGILFSLLATYRIERATRRDYLLTLRESLRSDRLAADNTTLARLSLTDPLTGLANRRAFTGRLGALWEASVEGRPFAVILIDVDHFKQFNDRYGHGAGDACLREISGILASLLPNAGDLVARYGGEEFAVLLPDCRFGDAIVVAERLRLGISARGMPHANRGDALAHVTVSVGVAARPGSAISPEALVDAADVALYEAKSRGRNQTYPMPAYFFDTDAEAARVPPATDPTPSTRCA